ncbi:MAG TPA: M56 family metallopeptidase [Thermoanaerobaculia bacterium]|nr:M56 family metallopeptidase [Thermoanaerobaculia bacterium]
MLDLWLAALVDASLKGLVLCLFAAAAALALRRSSAAARHLVWRLALAGLLALPVLAALLPSWRVPLSAFDKEVARTANVERSVAPPVHQAYPAARTLEPAVVAVTDPGASNRVAPKRPIEAVSWQAIAFGIWLAGGLAVLGSLAVALLRVTWRGRHAMPVVDADWTALLRQVCADLNVRRPIRLVQGNANAMPMTWGWRRPVVLVPAGAEAWPESRRRAVLLHELAHVARCDYAAQIAAEVVRALYWFNPLVWTAARRLRFESEQACDDKVLTAGAQAADYAGDLLDIARSFRAGRAAGLAMARPSQLAGRLLAVLDARRDRRGISRRFAVPAWLAAACVVIPLAALAPAVTAPPPPAAPAPPAKPAVPSAPSAPAAPAAPTAPAAPAAPTAKSTHRSIFSLNGNETYEWSKDGHRVRVRTEGKFQLTDDWTGIAHLDRGAEIRFDEENGRTERRLDVEPGDDGRPVYTWKVDGTKRAFDAEGKKWLQDMLLDFVRGSGFAAKERTASILKRQGPDGVLAEISQIPGDYVKRLYFAQLFASRGLGMDVVVRALRQAGREVKSDYDLAETLVTSARSQSLDDAGAQAYSEASRSIKSDYDQRRALSELVDKVRLSPASLASLLHSAQGIGSDYDCAELLVKVAHKDALGDAGVQRAYAEATDGIGSAYDRRRALSAAVERGDLSPEALLTVIHSARGINSAYDRATLLVELAHRYSLSGPARDAYLEASRSINSEYDRKRAEDALGRSGR